MHVQFIDRENGPDRLLCDAEVHFGETGPFAGMKLTGFSLWSGADGEVYITFPSRSFGIGQERRYFDFLRPSDGDFAKAKAVKAWMVAEYEKVKAAA